MRNQIPAPGWAIALSEHGLSLAHRGARSEVHTSEGTASEVLAVINGALGAPDISSTARTLLAKLDRRGFLTTQLIHEHQVLARHEPALRRSHAVIEAEWTQPVKALSTMHLRSGSDGPELSGGPFGDKVVLTSAWATEFSARLIAGEDVGNLGDLENQLLKLMSRAGLLVDGGLNAADVNGWAFHDAIFHAGSRIDSSFGTYGAKSPQMLGPRVPIPRPSIRERLSLSHDTVAASGMSLCDAQSLRKTVRDHGGAPIGLAELSALFDKSLRVRRVVDTAAGELAWRSIPTGGARSGLSAIVLAASVSGLARGAYEYDAVSHELAPASGPAPAVDRWLGLAERLTGIPIPSIQALVLFTLDYARPASGYESIVYATALKEVGAALQSMALVGADWNLAFCPMGGGFGNTHGLGEGIRSAAVVGEAVIGRPAHDPSGDPL